MGPGLQTPQRLAPMEGRQIRRNSIQARGNAGSKGAGREGRTGRLLVGEPWEQHAHLRYRLGLGRCTAGWLTDGFIDRRRGDFLTRGEAFRRFPDEAGRTRGHGTANW